MATHSPNSQAAPVKDQDDASQSLSRYFEIPPETITDGSLCLRRWREEDVDGVFDAAATTLPELARWMPWAANGYSKTQAEAFLSHTRQSWNSGNAFDYAVLLDGQISGATGLMKRPDGVTTGVAIGYWLAAPATGRGVATRTTKLLVQTAFAIGAQNVQILHHEQNAKSEGIPRRLGFNNMGTRPSQHYPGNDVVWQLEREARS